MNTKMNKECLRRSMNTFQSKDHRIETYRIKKVSLPCFCDKICTLSNGYDELCLGY